MAKPASRPRNLSQLKTTTFKHMGFINPNNHEKKTANGFFCRACEYFQTWVQQVGPVNTSKAHIIWKFLKSSISAEGRWLFVRSFLFKILSSLQLMLVLRMERSWMSGPTVVMMLMMVSQLELKLDPGSTITGVASFLISPLIWECHL